MGLTEVINNNIIEVPKLESNLDPRGLGYIFFNKMIVYQNQIAQIDGINDETDTYGMLLQRCIRTALVMKSKGVVPGDIISACTYNHLNSCVPFIATLLLGATTATFDPDLAYSEVVYLMQKIRPKMIFVSSNSLELIGKALDESKLDIEIISFEDVDNYGRFSDFILPHPQETTFRPVEIENLKDALLMFFSSGTSGFPKVLCISHRTYYNNIMNTTNFGLCPDVLLTYSTLYWSTSVLWLSFTIVTGSARILVPKFDEKLLWDIIKKHKPTFIFLTPYQIIAFNNQPKRNDVDSSCVKDLLTGGTFISASRMLEIMKLLPSTRVIQTYGQSEVAGFMITFKSNDSKDLSFIKTKPGSTGRGVPGMSYKIVDIETGKTLGPNQRGELRVKTEFQLSGYYKHDSSDIWDEDGWLKTGDVSYYDKDCCFYIVDRIKDMLKFRSYRVAPAAIEKVLLEHPTVAAAVVVGVPHPEDGDHPMAVVALKKLNINVTAKEIENYVEERMHDRERLRGGVKIVEEIPATPTGKFKRREIIEMVRNGQNYSTFNTN